MFYLIGLGLDLKSISAKALEILEKCEKVYLESYTTDFHYSVPQLEKFINKKIKELGRKQVESEKIVQEGKNKDVALLVYGNPLSATTHIQLILACKKKKIKYKIIHSESVLTAIAETGLQLYKFGKTASMPEFRQEYKPDSWYNIILQNEKIKAHTLLLTDIGLNALDALKQLEQVCKKRNVCIDKIIICSKVGTGESKIFYDKLESLKRKTAKIKMPFCIIIPSEMHFLEKKALDVLREK